MWRVMTEQFRSSFEPECAILFVPWSNTQVVKNELTLQKKKKKNSCYYSRCREIGRPVIKM